MAQYSWTNCPEQVRLQITDFVQWLRMTLDTTLVGVYLHGSLAMGCFNPDRSDLDLLVVTKTGLPVEIKRDLAVYLLEHSQQPTPIEISCLREHDFNPWQYPTPFDYHYSETWREQVREQLARGEWRHWNAQRHTDPDLAAHVVITVNRGVTLTGAPIGDVFPNVPRQDYVAALIYDYEDSRDDIKVNPIYSVLNLCRVLAYLQEDRIVSKQEGGAWAITHLPDTGIIQQALDIYAGHSDDRPFDEAALKRFAVTVDQQVQSLLER